MWSTHARPMIVQLARYAVIGGSSTALNAGLFLLLRPFLDAVPANLVALTVTTVVSTEANRRFAFDGAHAHHMREWVQDVGTVLFYAGYSSVVLLGLHLVDPGATPGLEAAVVAVASVAGGLARFLVLRHWVFATGEHHTTGRPRPTEADSGPCSTTSPRST
ncbi:GtrA family protein [Pseudonocardia endophytica]|uniref:GtrA family protein n=1 Tax=Pseudonocardia endophytica TaxID=401976 RepID=UPI0014051513|nr:GtrA family protein [Pseudonocardia endophytica]